MYKLTTLPNHIKVITSPLPASHGVTTGVFVRAGSRFETDKVAGISHFLEHMFFKGTKKRPEPVDIARAIEGIGGYANAATSQDYTFFYNRVPSRHSHRALEVLADMINNSLFDPAAIEREKLVVLEELNMYLDTPSQHIYDLIMNLCWPGHPLGRNAIGAKTSINQFNRQDIMDYVAGYYQPRSMVISAAGNVSHRQVLTLAEKYFGHWRQTVKSSFQSADNVQAKPRVLVHYKNTDQVHLCLGLPSIRYDHPDEPILALLATILGTGMSSRLFLNLRERQGLCYSINTFVEKFKETGLFGVSAGLNTDKIELAIKSILIELKKISQDKVAKTELANAKEYVRGNLSLQMDNTDQQAIWYGNQALFYRRISTPAEKIKRLMQVTENDIIKLARKIFHPNRLNLALIGPFRKKDEDRFFRLLR